MASNGISEGNLHVPETASTDLPSRIPPEEDESEWEYEYSQTETETFYITLDLSKADFTSRDATTVNRPGYRGGEKAERAKLYLNRRMSPSNGNGNSSDDSDEDKILPRVRKPKEPEPQPQPQPQPKEPTEDDNEDDHQVQIMDLHSEHPVISYRGRVYEGIWNQNVGTELLLTKRDEYNPLPVLRHLDHDVELLAASCARITVKEMDLNPKDDLLKRQRNADASTERNALGSLVPPAERWSTRERIDQGNFLANFIALKKRRGETDDVTVIAKSVERPDRNRHRKHDHGREKQGHRGKFNLPHPRGPRKAKGSDLLRTLSIREREGSPALASSVEDNGGSTPTPAHWTDLEGVDEEEDEEQDEEEGEVDGEGEGAEGEEDEEMMDDANEEYDNEEYGDLEENEYGSSSGSNSGSSESAEEMDWDAI
ncbi:hypothetical protein F4804DRAFT_305158 [Jackrogersella minutella]|nr:hypothetical protein F4804DRAFT_305158 [Jackrogersella minutella]